MSTPEKIIDIYDRLGPDWAGKRDRRLMERRWLDRMLSYAPRTGARRTILDLGCGAGRPIGEYLVDRGNALTGVDAAHSMIKLFNLVLPQATAFQADMRGLDLQQKFDAIIAWDSFFHLSPDDQRGMFATFARHAQERTVLLFTSGPDDGVSIGDLEGEPLYHASLSPDEYRDLLAKNGFEVLDHMIEDPDCGFHTVWLARFTGV